jgi:hypothetical protein
MLKCPQWMHSYFRAILVPLIPVLLAGCLATRGFIDLASRPYPVIYEDEATEKFSDRDDTAFIEVRRRKVSRPLENLAIHYAALFPGGEIVRPGDTEEYVKIGGKNAYKVVFRTNYIRRRKRVTANDKSGPGGAPPGWTLMNIEDPTTGKPMPVLYGPVIPRQRILYLVEGDNYIYYIFMRADGDAIDSARKKFEKFVREDIKYG